MPSNDQLEPLNPLAARSTWWIIFAFAVPLLNRYGIYPTEWFGLARGDSAGLFELLWPLIFVLVAMWERRAPRRRISLAGPLK